MKRLALLLIVLVLVASFSTGCGRTEEAVGDRDTPKPTDEVTTRASKSPAPKPSQTAAPSGDPQPPEPAAPQQLIPFSNGDGLDPLYGYMDQEGRVVIQPKFTMAEPFRACGLAIAYDVDGKAGLIDKTGNYVTKPNSAYFSYSEGLFLSYSNEQNRTYAYDESGKLVFEKEGYIGYFSDGLAASFMDNEKGYIDKTGKLVLELPYDNLTPFIDGYAAVSSTYSSPRFLIDKSGNDVTAAASSGFRMIQDASTQLYGFADMDGNPVFNCDFVYAEPFRDYLSIVCLNFEATGKQYGVINSAGIYVLDPIYTSITRMRNGTFVVGPEIIQGVYPATGFEGYSKKAIFARGFGHYTDYIFTDVENFDENYICVSDGKEVYYLDADLKRVDELPTFSGKGLMLPDGDLLRGTLNGHPTVADRKGNIIVQDKGLRFLGEGIYCVTETVYPDDYSEVSYPVISGMKDTDMQNRLNEIIRKQAMSTWQPPAPDPEDPYWILVLHSASSVVMRKDLLQITTSVDDYVIGGAHGSYYLDVRFINTKNGNEYTLTDLFKSTDDALEYISGVISDRMRFEPDMYYDPEAGVTPDQVKFFYLNDDGITVYFGVYEIAPYVAGMPEFRLTFDELSEFIDYDGEFWKSFN